jgi:TRAP-type uncharacterized transport system fused permease subunit
LCLCSRRRLILVAKGFTWTDFAITFTGCVLGITFLAMAFSKFFLVEMKRWEQALCIAAALLMVAPSLSATLIGVGIVLPVLLRQFKDWRLTQVAHAQTR